MSCYEHHYTFSLMFRKCKTVKYQIYIFKNCYKNFEIYACIYGFLKTHVTSAKIFELCISNTKFRCIVLAPPCMLIILAIVNRNNRSAFHLTKGKVRFAGYCCYMIADATNAYIHLMTFYNQPIYLLIQHLLQTYYA